MPSHCFTLWILTIIIFFCCCWCCFVYFTFYFYRRRVFALARHFAIEKRFKLSPISLLFTHISHSAIDQDMFMARRQFALSYFFLLISNVWVCERRLLWEKKTNARQFKKTSELLVACFVFSRRTFLSFFCFTRRTCQQQYYIFLQTFSPLLIFLFFFTILQRAEAKFGLEPKQKIYLKIKFTFSLNRECKSKFIKIWPFFNGGFRGKKAQSALKAKYLNCSQTTDFLVSPKIRIFFFAFAVYSRSEQS